jgi:hypothetical protein
MDALPDDPAFVAPLAPFFDSTTLDRRFGCRAFRKPTHQRAFWQRTKGRCCPISVRVVRMSRNGSAS